MTGFLELDNGLRLPLDEHGFLLNREDWSESVAEQFARNDEIHLTEGHWLVIRILRAYFENFEIEPPMRALVKELRDSDGASIANSLELYRLFPEGPVKQGSRYAGLPIPISCI